MIALGAVLIALSAAAPAPSEPSEYEFNGRLAYRAWDGALVPVVPDTVRVGWGDGACQFTLQSPEEVHVEVDGTFHVSVALISNSMTRVVVRHPDGSVDPPTCEDSASWPCYRFRAAGCDDRIVQFGSEPPSPLLELNCPVRRGPRPQSGG